jgi:RNA polymerase sigma factor (sigma-70 family)
MLLTNLIRDALLEHSLPADAPSPSAALYESLYQKALSLVPPSATAHRGPEKFRNQSDEERLSAYLQGEPGAFEALMESHLGWMVAWARRRLPESEAEDAVQEAFIALVHKADELTLETGTSLRGFLFGLLRIAVLRSRRTLTRHQGEPLEDGEGEGDAPVAPEPSPEDELFKKHSIQQLKAALTRVCSDEEQEVILLHHEGMDDKTIAETLRITSTNHVRVKRYRAMARLREELTKAGTGGGK